jgi:branched-chain amino acid transport system permease protein
VGVLVLYSIIQLAISTEIINAYWAQILTLACIVTIASFGLSIIYGYTGQFSLGHAAFYGIGAYAAALVTRTLGGDNILYLVIALIAGTIAAAIVAFIIGLPILRLRSDYLGIATLGFGIIVKVMLDNSDAIIPIMGGARGLSGVPKLASFGWAFFLAVGALLVMRNLIYSRQGRAFLAIRENEIAADTMGINTAMYKTLAFVIGGAFAGLAGGLFAHSYPILTPASFDWIQSVNFLLIVVLGGLGSMSGTLITAVAWTLLLEGLRVVLPSAFLDWRMVIYPILLVAMMLLRPSGLMGNMELGFLRQPRVAKLSGRQQDGVNTNDAPAGS